jgi:hypothetical protein
MWLTTELARRKKEIEAYHLLHVVDDSQCRQSMHVSLFLVSLLCFGVVRLVVVM